MPRYSAQNPIAYFSAEYGLQSDLPIYAGGLGILSGDTIKQAGDEGFPMVAIGLLYQGCKARQSVDTTGMQQEEDFPYEPNTRGIEPVLIDDLPLFVKVHLTEFDVWLQCWKKSVGSLTLYLLDTDTDQNDANRRHISHGLYLGDDETTIKQQLVLGVGGVKLLHALNIHPAIYHVNEGRPAFLHWQLIRSYMDAHGIDYEEARNLATLKTVYTNHTLVGAGNKSYNIQLLKRYGQYYSDKMHITIDELLQPGIEGSDQHFSLTRFAMNTSVRTNGVSQLHTNLCKENWPEYDWVNVTNAVHMPTWQDPQIRNASPDGPELWHLHQQKKYELMEAVRRWTGFGYDPQHLVLVWARRIAGYKQLDKLFEDTQRLTSILKHASRPCQLLVAGKAHANDGHGKDILQKTIQHMQNSLAGSAIYIPNYSMEVALPLVKGADLWINIPEYGHEASGTSGMKAIANGILQCSVKDGWVWEIDLESSGWTIDHTGSYSASFYQLMEEHIAPLFYARDEQGIPQAWLSKMKAAIGLSSQFDTARMLKDYTDKLYTL